MKAIQQAARILIITGLIIAAAAIYSCTENQSGGKGNVSNAQNGSGGQYIVITGANHSLNDLVTSPLLRTSIREYCYSMTMIQMAEEAGVTVSDEEVNEQVDMTRENVDRENMTWQSFLDSQFVTEEEFWLNAKYSIMFEKLVESRVEVTEEAKLKIWDMQQASLIEQYLAENNLPDSERSNVTYEKVEPMLEERTLANLKTEKMVEVRGEIIQATTLDIPTLEDAEKQQQFEDLIINKAREAQAAAAAGNAAPGLSMQ